MQANFKLTPFQILRPVTQNQGPVELPKRQQAAQGTESAGKELPPVAGLESAAVVDQEQLDKAVKRLSDFIQQVKRELEFSVDEQSGRTIITVINADTDEVIRQIPPEEVLSLAHNLDSGDVSFLEAKA